MAFVRIFWIFVLFHMKFAVRDDDLTFKILHIGNMYGQVESFGKREFGGLPRIIAFLKKERESDTPVLFFDTGDIFTGSLIFMLYGVKVMVPFYKIMKPDAICFGEHEVNEGVSNLTEFIEAVSVPLLCCNCILKREPELQKLIVPSTKLKVKDTVVGVIGYLTDNAQLLSSKFENIIVHDEMPYVRNEIRKFQEENVTIIILLGHGGVEEDIKLALEVEGIDIIVAGHSQTFLYNGKVPSSLKRLVRFGDYPLMVKNTKGVDVPIAHAYKQGQIVGKMSVTFNRKGILLKCEGNPVVMDKSIKVDAEAKAILNKYLPALEDFKKHVLGSSRVDLHCSCTGRECNMANLMTDSWVDFLAGMYKGQYWTDTPVAIAHAGMFGQDVILKKPDRNITRAQIIEASVHQQFLYILEINGSAIRRIIEYSLVEDTLSDRKFLQYSGIRVKLNLAKEGAQAIESIRVRCSECYIPSYEDIKDQTYYRIAVPDYLANGGDGFHLFKEGARFRRKKEKTTSEILRNYIKYYKVIQPNENERIIITGTRTPTSGRRRTKTNGSQLCTGDAIIILMVTITSTFGTFSKI